MVLAGEADALVTCPISKEAIAAGGSDFPGHTEMLASLTGAPDVLMVLAGSELRVALVTRHVALRDVAGLLQGGRHRACRRALRRGPAALLRHRASRAWPSAA